MDFEIIDFHTHPFTDASNNICAHKDFCDMSTENILKEFKKLGVSKICGSVGTGRGTGWQRLKESNDNAIMLRDYFDGFYIPGFKVSTAYMEESINEIHRMHKAGVKIMGELCPYLHDWDDYSSDEFSLLLDEAAKYNMIVSFHSQGEDEMDAMVRKHKDIIFVAAHPGEYNEFMRHIERMKMSENYYLDLSGYGMFRHGMLRRLIDVVGIDRILFGSDYPTCNPGMYIGGVLLDNLITDSEKEKIFSLNAKKLLKI